MFAHFTRMAFKALLKFKMHSLISLLSLSFGFVCFISAILLSNYTDSYDQEFPNAQRIYYLVQKDITGQAGLGNLPIVNEPAAKYLRIAFPEIPNIVGATPSNSDDVTVGNESFSLDTRYVEERFFDIFPLPMLSGLEQGQDIPPNSAIITAAAAERVFGTTAVVGERLLLNNRDDLVIAGVSERLDHPSHLESSISLFNTELYVPASVRDRNVRNSRIEAGLDPDADYWGNQGSYVYLEFPPGFEFSEASFNAQLDAFVKSTLPEDRVEYMTFEVEPINQLVTSQLAFITGGFDMTDVLVVAGALVLLIGCLNYSNLVIAQLALRSQEVAVQKILGAKRSLLVLQYSFESLIFIFLALLFSLALFAVLLTFVQSTGFVGVGPSMLLNASLWAALAVVMVVIVAIAGTYPALRTATVSLVTMMRPKGSGGYSGRLRAIMVGVQYFISGTLIVLAMIMFSQNGAMTAQLDGDFADPKIAITVPVSTFSADPELFTTQLEQHPSILSVTRVANTPWSISMSSISLADTPDLNTVTTEYAIHNVGLNFTDTMDVPFLAGREFEQGRSNDLFPNNDELLDRAGPFAAMVDAQAANAMGYENPQDAIGQTIYRHFEPPSVENPLAVELNIIGLVGEQKFQFIDFSTFGVEGNVYMHSPDRASYMIIKIAKDGVNDAIRHIDDTWARLMPDLVIKRQFVDELFYDAYQLFLAISSSIAALSILGFLIASIGLLGNATFITNIRQKEVGIRKVMGASSGRLFRMLLLDFAKPILIANAIAWPVGYMIGSVYVSLFAVRTGIGITPFLVSLLLSVIIAIAAVGSQSWKSARVRPAAVLRYE